jgi:hypothetical protein
MFYNAIVAYLKSIHCWHSRDVAKGMEKLKQEPIYRRDTQRSEVIEINEWLGIEIKMLVALKSRHSLKGIKNKIERLENLGTKNPPVQITKVKFPKV